MPQIGFLCENMLLQGLTGLLPMLLFILTISVNTLLFYVTFIRSNETFLHSLSPYFLGILAIETCISIYAFYIAGLDGLRYGLLFFHLFFIGLSLCSYRRFKEVKIHLRLSKADLLLLLFSIGLLMLVYVPHGLYNLFSDHAVVIDNILSITHRVDLQPYYSIDEYYSPIMGFISILFSYTTGLNNLILSSNLVFLSIYLISPFIIYNFVKSFIINDSRIAVLISIIVSLMDGLAVILLPLYVGNISNDVINWSISPVTQSLYFSNISVLVMCSYKAFAATAAVAACCVLQNRKVISYIFGGGLCFISFVNPRFSLLVIILLIFLLGLRKIDFKGLFIFLLSIIIFGGLTFTTHLYKQLHSALLFLHQKTFIVDDFFNSQLDALNYLVSDKAYPIIIFIICLSILGIVVLSRFSFKNKSDNLVFTDYFSERKFPSISINFTKNRKNLLISSLELILICIISLLFIYLVFNAYSPTILSFFTQIPYFGIIRQVMLRYHVLFLFFIFGLFVLKYNKRIAITILFANLFFFIFGYISNSIYVLPFLFAILAVPLFNLFVKRKRKILVFLFLLFTFLGLFSSTFYSALPKSSTTSSIYLEVPEVLTLLINEEAGTNVYTPSSYTYYVMRLTRMAHLNLTSDSTCKLYLIDNNNIHDSVLDTYLNNEGFKVLFNGNRFTLLERKSGQLDY